MSRHPPCLLHVRMHIPLVINKMGTDCHIELCDPWSPSIAGDLNFICRLECILRVTSHLVIKSWNNFFSVKYFLLSIWYLAAFVRKLNFRLRCTGRCPCSWNQWWFDEKGGFALNIAFTADLQPSHLLLSWWWDQMGVLHVALDVRSGLHVLYQQFLHIVLFCLCGWDIS